MLKQTKYSLFFLSPKQELPRLKWQWVAAQNPVQLVTLHYYVIEMSFF